MTTGTGGEIALHSPWGSSQFSICELEQWIAWAGSAGHEGCGYGFEELLLP